MIFANMPVAKLRVLRGLWPFAPRDATTHEKHAKRKKKTPLAFDWVEETGFDVIPVQKPKPTDTTLLLKPDPKRREDPGNLGRGDAAAV